MYSVSESVGSGVLSRVRAASQREPNETEEAYEDRIAVEAFHQLRREMYVAKGNVDQKDIQERYIAAHLSKGECMATLFCDFDMRLALDRLHADLQRETSASTPIRRLLLDRLLLAVNDGIRYERMSTITNYRIMETPMTVVVSDHPHHIKCLAEIRKGKESVDERILRLAQALEPNAQVVVQTTNAFFANNQQVNQDAAPKDLEKISEQTPHAKAHS